MFGVEKEGKGPVVEEKLIPGVGVGAGMLGIVIGSKLVLKGSVGGAVGITSRMEDVVVLLERKTGSVEDLGLPEGNCKEKWDLEIVGSKEWP